jgi:hypothetical protein
MIAPPEPIADSSVTWRRTQAAIFVFSHGHSGESLEVVGVNKIKLFRNFFFQNSTVIFTGY